MCSGRIVGSAEALFGGFAVEQFVFDVPILTGDFPASQPGPP